MGRVIVIEFVTLDGVITDPDGSAGTAQGGWGVPPWPGDRRGRQVPPRRTTDEGVFVLGRATACGTSAAAAT